MGSVGNWFSNLLSQNPFAGYMLADWLRLALAVGAGMVWVWGVWGAYRYSKTQISKRLLEYLKNNEEGILNARKALLRRLEFGETVDRLVANRHIEEALGFLKSARVLETQVRLQAFQRLLTKSARIGEQHRDIASRQAATVLLLMGILAMRQNQTLVARQHLEHALDLTKSDAAVRLQLARLEFELGNAAQCLTHCQVALNDAGTDDELKAEVWSLRAAVHKKQRKPAREKSDLGACAPLFLQLKKWPRAAESYARLGELQENLGPRGQVRNSYERALESFERAADWTAAEALRRKLGLPSGEPQDRSVRTADLWQWLRLTTEVAILFSGFFMLVSRT